MTFKVIIPARYASSRLPGKPLLDIAGKPMIQHVYERACQSDAEEVIVATDDELVHRACRAFGATVQMTSADHPTGTDRLAEVVRVRREQPDTIIVNVQGDEPLIAPAAVNEVAQILAQTRTASIGTLCEKIDDPETLFDPSAVKVVFNADGLALYFSRAPIPWCREAFAAPEPRLPVGIRHFRHLGIYAYRVGYLLEYVDLTPAPLEKAESLEQLRALHHGASIVVAETVAGSGPGIDTQADLERVRALVEAARP